MRKIITVLLLVTIAVHTNAKVKMPYIFSNGMVLQQQSNAAIWGKSAPGGNVSLLTSWNKKTYTVKVNADSTWRIKVETPKAGGPYQITVTDDAPLVIKDVLIGEVWFISGQSNMEMPLVGRKAKGKPEEPIEGGAEAIANSTNHKIRFFRGRHKTWGTPLDDVPAKWRPANLENSPIFSALGYFFAQKLHEKLNVPIGIVQVAYGGTPIEAWMSRESLVPFGKAVKLPEEKNEALKNKLVHTGLFNGMVSPVLGFTIKGVLWYQGETNRAEPTLYAKLFPVMVADWRKRWGNGDFPFYYVQIAPYAQPPIHNPYVPFFREAQLKSLDVIPNSGMVVNIDLGTEQTIHPPYKEKLADRMLVLVLNKTYGLKDVFYQGPVFNSLEVRDNTAILNFDFSDKGLRLNEENHANFEIAGKDRKFYPAKSVKIVGNKIELVSNEVKIPVAVRYAFKAWTMGNLYNTEGFPASSFRTDNWDL